MLLNIADAYGAGFEFAPYATVHMYNLGKSYNNTGNKRIKLGHDTDDTQMSLALCEMILSNKTWTTINIAQAFLDTFHRDKKIGYSTYFFKFLEENKTGKDFLDNIIPFSKKSGAAMRSAPLGFYPEISDVIGKTQLQACITHNTYEGITSSVAVALSSHYFIYKIGKKKDLANFISTYVPGKWDNNWSEPVSTGGMNCAKAAISSVISSNTLTELLIRCVALTGDTDTVSAIAFGIASHCDEIKDDLSKNLLQELENGIYGRDYLQSIDDQLLSKFKV